MAARSVGMLWNLESEIWNLNPEEKALDLHCSPHFVPLVPASFLPAHGGRRLGEHS